MTLTKTCLSIDCPERTGGACNAGPNPQVVQGIMDILKAPAESEFSTADVAVNMMSSTTLREKSVKIARILEDNSGLAYEIGDIDGRIDELHGFLDAVKRDQDPHDYVADRVSELRKMNQALRKKVGIES